MTFVAGPIRCPVGFESFADITDAAAAFPGGGVEFDADLTPEQQADVWWRFTSRDDADETARRNLAALRDALAVDPSPANRDALLIALTNYRLND